MKKIIEALKAWWNRETSEEVIDAGWDNIISTMWNDNSNTINRR